MNRNILITFTMMIIALIGLGVASAADNGTVNDVEINDIDDVVVVDDTVDSIDDVDDVVSDVDNSITKMEELSAFCMVAFNAFLDAEANIKDGIATIRINDLDIYNITTEKEFLEKIFTIFHELGHYKQDIEYDQYTDDIKGIITIEKYLAENDREFYHMGI